MSGFLLNTNVVSELRKEERCDPGVRQWMEGAVAEELFVSVLVLGEIRQGIERIRTRDRAQARHWKSGCLGFRPSSRNASCPWTNG